VRHRRLRSLVGDPHRRPAQAPEPPQQRGGERDREQRGDREGDDRRDQEAVAHLADELGRLRQLALRHEHAEQTVARPQRPRDEHRITVHLGRRPVQRGDDRHVQRAWRRRGGLAVVDEALARGVRVGRLGRVVLEQDARVRALRGQLAPLVEELEAIVLSRDAVLLERAELARERVDVLVDGSLEVFDALVPQPVLHRRQHHQGDRAERDRAGGHERQQQPPAQARRQPPSHDSRKR
jgi:hypothetical protein